MKDDELVKALQGDAKWVKRISWQNAPTNGSAEFLKVSGRIGDAATRIEQLASENANKDTQIAALNECIGKLKKQNMRLIWRRWIPISEGLPEPDFQGQARTWVLVALESGCVKDAKFEFNPDSFCGYGFEHTGTPITHWQPLPQPPKGE